MPADRSDRWNGLYKASLERLFARYGLQPRSRLINLSDPAVQAHLLEMGAGGPLVLIHGGGGTAGDWAPLAARLAAEHHLYLLEMPGHGLSAPVDFEGADVRAYAARFLHGVLAELGLTRADFVANSIGGYWTLAFALAHPDRVNRIVLAGAPGGFESRVPPVFRLIPAWGMGRLLLALATRASRAMCRRTLCVAVAHPDRMPDEYIDTVWHAARLPGRMLSYRSMVRQLSPFPGPSRMAPIRSEVCRLRAPVLFIWGGSDAFGAPGHVQEILGKMPAGRLEMVPGAGHFPWMDEPALVASLVRGFLT